MEISCAVIELKPNTQEKVLKWAQFLRDNHEEAIATLKNEGVTVESAFVVNIESKEYLIIYMRAANMAKAYEAVKTSTFSVDAFHQAFKKECWGTRFKATTVADLSRIVDERRYA